MDSRTKQHTLGEILDRYHSEHFTGISEKTKRDYTRHIATLRAAFGERIASEISRADLIKFMDVRTGKLHRNKTLSVLSSAFNAAVGWEWVTYNPCSGVPRHESTSRSRYVTPEEFDGFKRVNQKNLSLVHMLDLARYSGREQGELLALRWNQIEDKKGFISFRKPKSHAREEVSISPKLRAVLADCKRTATSKTYVVARRNGQRYTSDGFRAMWQRYMRRWIASGNEGFDFYDIRHTWSILEKSTSRTFTFAPTVFQVPDGDVERDLVAVMMPFAAQFDPVYEAMRRACDDCGLRCLRASDIWEATAIIQDIFSLIYRAHVVVVDFTGRNANVMYETGIAHTLGKTVVPLSQSLDDVPFDIKHHRVLPYLANREGLEELRAKLAARLGFIAGQSA